MNRFLRVKCEICSETLGIILGVPCACNYEGLNPSLGVQHVPVGEEG